MEKKCKDCDKKLENRNKSGFCNEHVRQHTMKTHGMSKTKEYKTWCRMKNRCHKEDNVSYPRYGGVGIMVCDRWINSFENFYKDMGNRPLDHSIDRINSFGNYSPENCRWADLKTQARNKKSVTIYKGKTFGDYERELGLKKGAIYARINHYGWDIEKAVTTNKHKNETTR